MSAGGSPLRNGDPAPARGTVALRPDACPSWLRPLVDNVDDVPDAARRRLPADSLARSGAPAAKQGDCDRRSEPGQADNRQPHHGRAGSGRMVVPGRRAGCRRSRAIRGPGTAGGVCHRGSGHRRSGWRRGTGFGLPPANVGRRDSRLPDIGVNRLGRDTRAPDRDGCRMPACRPSAIGRRGGANP